MADVEAAEKPEARGRPSFSLNERDGFVVTTADGTTIDVFVSRISGGRVTVSVDAPLSSKVSRKPR